MRKLRVIPEREPICNPSEVAEESHRQFLTEFKRDVFPIMSQYGMTMAEALNYWMLTQLENRLGDVLDAIRADKGDWD